MGCNSCGSGGGGGCNNCKLKSACHKGSCNIRNVYDWLADLPVANDDDRCSVVEVSFNNASRKAFFRNTTSQPVYKGDIVAVEGVNGFDVGEVCLSGQLVRLQLKKKGVKEDAADMKRVLRLASEYDLAKWKETKAREKEVLIRSRAIAHSLKLGMKMSQVEIQADARKATFYYIADERVDFRELIKLYASEFKVKVEMRQIGARQEAGKIGGIGTSGRELCCGTWISNFKSVNTAAARYQNLSINQSKLTGQCGRLKCCLNYELDTYLDALQNFPEDADRLQLAKGDAFLVKRDIFRNLMWYSTSSSTKYYPLSIDTVKEILELNKKGVKPDELRTEEVISEKAREIDTDFVDVVGQISLKSLEKTSQKKSHRSKQAKMSTRNDRSGQGGVQDRQRNGNSPRKNFRKKRWNRDNNRDGQNGDRPDK